MLLILHKYRPPSCPTPPPADPPQDSAPMTLSSRTCSLPPHSFPLELGQCPSPSTLCSGPRFLPLVWLSSHSVAQYPPRPNPELSSEGRDCFSHILTSPGKWNDRAGGGRALTELAAGPAGRRGQRAEQSSVGNCCLLTRLSCPRSLMKIHWIFPLVCSGLGLKTLRSWLAGCAS